MELTTQKILLKMPPSVENAQFPNTARMEWLLVHVQQAISVQAELICLITLLTFAQSVITAFQGQLHLLDVKPVKSTHCQEETILLIAQTVQLVNTVLRMLELCVLKVFIVLLNQLFQLLA